MTVRKSKATPVTVEPKDGNGDGGGHNGERGSFGRRASRPVTEIEDERERKTARRAGGRKGEEREGKRLPATKKRKKKKQKKKRTRHSVGGFAEEVQTRLHLHNRYIPAM